MFLNQTTSKQSSFQNLAFLYSELSARRKVQLLFLMVLVFLTSFAEVFSIGAAMPFIIALSSPNRLYEIDLIVPFLNWANQFGILSFREIFTIVFLFGILLSSSLRVLLLYLNSRLSFAIGADLSITMYSNTLHQPYWKHLERNSAEVISGITAKSKGVISLILQPSLNFVTSFMVLSVMLIGLLSIDIVMTLGSALILGFTYYFVALLSKRKLLRNGELLAKNASYVQKALQEGLGGIRDVIIDRSQEYYLTLYRNSEAIYRNASAENLFIGSSPRIIVETISIFVFVGMGIWLFETRDNFDSVFPVLGAMALGAQKILPFFQQLYNSWTSLIAGTKILEDVILLLDRTHVMRNYEDEGNRLHFDSTIDLENLSFSYSGRRDPILCGVNLSIKKGAKIGVIGKTGSGKSTLIDILLGLLQSESGTLSVDGTKIEKENVGSWQKCIAHVPQTIFLSDASIAENIAFGIGFDKVDMDLVESVCKRAKLHDFIQSLPEGYHTFVGERGVRLSGGQRQRIGIARALYKKAELIVFDEATSALDVETENEIMDSIHALGDKMTIIIVAHRLSTIKKCDEVYEVIDQKLRLVDRNSI